MAEWTAREKKFYEALRGIASYQSPERLQKEAWDLYGCSPDQAVEMAYENIIQEAKVAIKGVRKPKD